MAVDDTGADDGGDGDAVGDLAHQGSSGGQSGRVDVCADIVVDDHSGGQVEADFKALEHEQGLLEVLGRFHLGDQTEEGDMSTVGEHDVRDGLEGSVKVVLDGSLNDTARMTFDTHGYHGDHDSAEDTEERGEGDPGHSLHGTGNGEDKREDHADDTEDNGAGAVVGDGVHHDAECEDVAAHDEDAEKELANTEELAAELAQQNLASITEVLDVRVPFTEKADVVSGVCSEKTQANNQDNTRDEAQGSDSRGQ